MFDVDAVGLLARELLRERTPALLAEVCAWSVGLSDRPYVRRRGGRIQVTGETLGLRAETARQLGDEPDDHLELPEAAPGTFGDVLAALTPQGRVYADLLEVLVLAPFVLDTCVRAIGRVRRERPAYWLDLLDDLGEDGDDLAAVVRTGEWEEPLRILAEQLVLAALADQPLVEVEAEGLPLSLVRAAEEQTRQAAPVEQVADGGPGDEELAGALFLAEAAVSEAGLPVPVPLERADALLDALLGEGLEVQEVLAVLPHLPVTQDAVEEIDATVQALVRGGQLPG